VPNLDKINPDTLAAEIEEIGKLADDTDGAMQTMAKGLVDGLNTLLGVVVKPMAKAKEEIDEDEEEIDEDEEEIDEDEEEIDEDEEDDEPGFEDMQMSRQFNDYDQGAIDATEFLTAMSKRIERLEKGRALDRKLIKGLVKSNQQLARGLAGTLAPMGKAVVATHEALMSVPDTGFTAPARPRVSNRRRQEIKRAEGPGFPKDVLAKARMGHVVSTDELRSYQHTGKFDAYDDANNTRIIEAVKTLQA